MNKKVVIIGGGTGASTLVKGLKKFPLDITVVVSVSDDGSSSGILRKEFDIPAVGDVRKVITSLSETEPLIEKLMNYRFNTNSDLNGHTIGNLLLTALCNITGNMSSSVESLSSILNLKGRVLPVTDSNVFLQAKMDDGMIVKGEHEITKYPRPIKEIYYEEEPKINKKVISEIKQADLIILSMGSLYTSVICNLLSKDIIDAIDKSKANIMYVCNLFTQPGETDNYKVSDHINTLNKYLGHKKISSVIVNTGIVDEDTLLKYKNEEQKSPVILDKENISNIKIISDNYVAIDNDTIKHDVLKLSLDIFKETID